jgi:hypothetical protein
VQRVRLAHGFRDREATALERGRAPESAVDTVVGASVAEVERGEDPDLPAESLLPLPLDRLAMHFESSGHRQPEDLLELIGELGPARDDPIVRASISAGEIASKWIPATHATLR